MAPFPPVTGPVTVGLAAEGAVRSTALVAPRAVTEAAASTQRMAAAAAAAAIRPRQRGVIGLCFVLIAGTFHDGPRMGCGPGRAAPEGNAANQFSKTLFS